MVTESQDDVNACLDRKNKIGTQEQWLLDDAKFTKKDITS